MKPTPTHPVPDLHRALKTLPLCNKCGNEWRDVVCVQRKVWHVYAFMVICGTQSHTFAVYILNANFKVKLCLVLNLAVLGIAYLVVVLYIYICM